ncbi:GDSL esterase/lipase At5g03610-like [Diospyros lotus]|uniref:GDSL esterase/lipase At5g03610-like n=1 Tax=Diospyros lotus TaxID=55363 RepID=UPI0022518A32|nr:GDSL esterase/lipase At5g03610-like [Diospyros lotus]
MEGQKLIVFLSFFCLLLFSFLPGGQASSHAAAHGGRLHRFHPKKIFVFGDSYSDTGNTPKSDSSAWKVPYGTTFPGKPAGRFSDGRILIDLLARALGLRSPVPYKWMKYAPDRLLKYGMNFAHGGTGVFETLSTGPNLTAQIHQLSSLVNNGSVFTTEDLQSALALVTVAGNDYSAYLAKGGSLQDLPPFITSVVNQLAVNLKSIHAMGLKRVAVGALQPLGCLPTITFANSFQQCNSTVNAAVDFHNSLLQQAVAKLNNDSHSNSSYFIIDLHSPFISVLNKTGNGDDQFETPLKPCCLGVSAEYSCGSVDKEGAKMYRECSNPEAAFFWDLFHPTQAGWNAVFQLLKSNLLGRI